MSHNQESNQSGASLSSVDELAAAMQQPRISLSERVIQFIEPLCKLYRSENGETFVKIRVNEHDECWNTKSGQIAEIILHLCYRFEHVLITEAVIKQVQYYLTSKAKQEGTNCGIYKRVAKHADKIYVDLGDESWRVIEISSREVQVLNESPVLFIRYEGMLSLPEPASQGSLDELRKLLPMLTAQQIMLVKGFILSCYQPDAPFPILTINGMHDCGKTAISGMLRKLIDPSIVSHQDLPKRDEDLWASAHVQRLLSFDNVSDISYNISDQICRISTGSSYIKRQHYEHKAVSVITTRNPIILNGIEPHIVRHDLLDRMINLEMPSLGGAVKSENDLEEEFLGLYPRLFGGICKYLQYYVRNQHKQYPVPKDVRMRDAVQFVNACCDGNPDAFDFYGAYQKNRQQTAIKALENEPIYMLITELLIEGQWSGTSSELLERINQLSFSRHHLRKVLPSNPHSLGIQLKRISPFLEKGGIKVGRERKNGGNRTRLITLSFIDGFHTSGGIKRRRLSLSKNKESR